MKKRYVVLGSLLLGLLLLALTIEDWRRDFTTNVAEIKQPLVVNRPVADVVRTLRSAAGRIGGWEFIGASVYDHTTVVVFERTSRVFRFVDDVTLRIEDRGDRSIITGESRSRVGKGDLGQNPRNLRHILSEMQAVFEGS